jgi:hypothetical protein
VKRKIKKSTIVVIAVGVIFLSIILLVFAGYQYEAGINNQKTDYCFKWKQSIEDRKTEIGSSFWGSLNSDLTEELNRDIENYNSQCAGQ